MTWTKCLFLCCLTVTLSLACESQVLPESIPQSTNQEKNVLVSEPVAALIRPILDEKQKGIKQDESRLSNLLFNLTRKQGHAADEALVVLMCFDVGESQEETDAVIARGKKMLPLLKKYQDRKPKIPDRAYPESILKDDSSKSDAFEGAIKAINHGWHSTADNPEG